MAERLAGGRKHICMKRWDANQRVSEPGAHASCLKLEEVELAIRYCRSASRLSMWMYDPPVSHEACWRKTVSGP